MTSIKGHQIFRQNLQITFPILQALDRRYDLAEVVFEIFQSKIYSVFLK